MKKVYIYLISIFTVISLFYHTLSSMGKYYSKYGIELEINNNIIKTISSHIIVPIIEWRIDYNLNKSGIINNIKKTFYDNKLLKIDDISKGDGKSVLCGQRILIEIKTEDNRIQEKIIILGTSKIRTLNIGIIGMKEGGKRKITVPNKFSEKLTKYEVTLKKILNHHPITIENLLIFENIKNHRKALMCGDEVSIRYKVRNINGKQISENSISFKIGEGKVPLAFELGTIEMMPGNERTIISPSDLLDENFPKDQISIIDLSIE